MTAEISEQYELELVEIEKEKETDKLDPKSWSELMEMCDSVLAQIAERKKRRGK